MTPMTPTPTIEQLIEQLIEQADQTPPEPIPLKAYREVLCILHYEKRMSAVKIAQWMKARGHRAFKPSTIYKFLKDNPRPSSSAGLSKRMKAVHDNILKGGYQPAPPTNPKKEPDS